MKWARSTTSDREFERFAVEVSDPLLRTGFVMTGNAKDAEDLVQETLLKVARRWGRVRSMDHPFAYARRVLVNLVIHDAERRSRQRIELQPHEGAAETADENAAQALREVDDLAEFRWALNTNSAPSPTWQPVTSTRSWPASGYSSATTGPAAAPGDSPQA